MPVPVCGAAALLEDGVPGGGEIFTSTPCGGLESVWISGRALPLPTVISLGVRLGTATLSAGSNLPSVFSEIFSLRLDLVPVCGVEGLLASTSSRASLAAARAEVALMVANLAAAIASSPAATAASDILTALSMAD